MSQWITWILLTNITCHLHPMAWPSASAHLCRSIAWSLSTCSLRPSMRTCASGSSGSWDVQMKEWPLKQVKTWDSRSTRGLLPNFSKFLHPTFIPLSSHFHHFHPSLSLFFFSFFGEKTCMGWAKGPPLTRAPAPRPPRPPVLAGAAFAAPGRPASLTFIKRKRLSTKPGMFNRYNPFHLKKTGDFWGELVVVESSGL